MLTANRAGWVMTYTYDAASGFRSMIGMNWMNPDHVSR
jgi:hypothetical protein